MLALSFDAYFLQELPTCGIILSFTVRLFLVSDCSLFNLHVRVSTAYFDIVSLVATYLCSI